MRVSGEHRDSSPERRREWRRWEVTVINSLESLKSGRRGHDGQVHGTAWVSNKRCISARGLHGGSQRFSDSFAFQLALADKQYKSRVTRLT
jgi:hypothetical protein